MSARPDPANSCCPSRHFYFIYNLLEPRTEFAEFGCAYTKARARVIKPIHPYKPASKRSRAKSGRVEISRADRNVASGPNPWRSEDSGQSPSNHWPHMPNRNINRNQRRERAPETEKSLNEIKHKICENIRRVAMRDGYTARQLAIILKTSESRVSKVTCFRTKELTTDALFKYLLTLEPRTEILIAI